MYIDKSRDWSNLYLHAPETEVGSGDEGGAPPATSDRMSIRESLQRGFEDAREEPEEVQEEKPSRQGKRGRFAESGPRRGSRTTPEPEEVSEVASEGEPDATEQPLGDAPATGTDTQPPAAWAREAKETWASLPPAAQQAILKREQDSEKGVEALKAQYKTIDDALAPHIQSLRQLNKTPAEAIQHLFGWFQALAANPTQAAPALFRSFNYSPQVIEAIGRELGFNKSVAAPPPAQEEPEEVPPWQQPFETIQEKLTKLEQTMLGRVSNFESAIAQQSMEKTQENLNFWAKDKPHFQEVRVMMGHLMTPDPNTGLAPVPLKDGKPDLDTAYEMACYAMPAVRAKIAQAEAAAAQKAAADKLAKEQAAQAAEVNKARKKAVSVAPGAPAGDTTRPDKKGARQSVRESINAAIAESRS